jgi:hypothetical protein
VTAPPVSPVPPVPCSRCTTPLPFAEARCPSCGTQAEPPPELARVLKNPYAARDRLDDEHLDDFIEHADRAGTPHTKAVARAIVRLRSELSQLRAAATKGTP